MNALTEVAAKVDEYSKKLIHSPLAQESPLELKISEIGKKNSVWVERVGVYVFYGEDKIHYIGRALKGTRFGARIADQIALCNKEYAKPWQDILKNSDTKIALFAFSNIKDDYWAASLELFLIDAFWDQVKKFNKRRG